MNGKLKFKFGKFGVRYQKYRVFYFLSVFLFLAGVVLAFFLFSSRGGTASIDAFSWKAGFPAFFVFEATWYLASFLLGITVYAPCFQILASLMRGVLSGILLEAVTRTFSQKGGIFLFLLFLLYAFLSASLFSTYSSFCTLVALRLFTDPRVKSVREEEGRMFGGTLFNSTFYRNTVNLRFLAVYILFFFASLFFCGLICFSFAFFRSFIG